MCVCAWCAYVYARACVCVCVGMFTSVCRLTRNIPNSNLAFLIVCVCVCARVCIRKYMYVTGAQQDGIEEFLGLDHPGISFGEQQALSSSNQSRGKPQHLGADPRDWHLYVKNNPKLRLFFVLYRVLHIVKSCWQRSLGSITPACEPLVAPSLASIASKTRARRSRW